MLQVDWFEVEFTGKKRVPAKMRTIAIDDGGEVYCAAEFFTSPMDAFLCASFDGTMVLVDKKNNAFYPLSWLRKEWPKRADIATRIDEMAAMCRKEASAQA